MDKVTYVFLTLMAKIRSIMSDIADIRKSSAAGAPTKVTKASEMTDTDKNYLYLGTESGYNSGHIYYFVEGVLTDGGAYGGVNVDATLTQSGQAADAKATGDKIAEIKEDLNAKQDALTFDTTPTHGSTNPVTSGGVATALTNITVPVDATLTQSGQAADAKATGDAIATIDGVEYAAAYGLKDGLTRNGYRLNENGYLDSRAGYTVKFYRVVPNEILYLNLTADGPVVYDFLTTSSNPSSSSGNIVSVETTAVNGFVMVPATANYIAVCQLQSNETNEIKTATAGRMGIIKEVYGILDRQEIVYTSTDLSAAANVTGSTYTNKLTMSKVPVTDEGYLKVYWRDTSSFSASDLTTLTFVVCRLVGGTTYRIVGKFTAQSVPYRTNVFLSNYYVDGEDTYYVGYYGMGPTNIAFYSYGWFVSSEAFSSADELSAGVEFTRGSNWHNQSAGFYPTVVSTNKRIHDDIAELRSIIAGNQANEPEKYVHFSIDDCTFWTALIDNAETYNSAFEEPHLALYKSIHDAYGFCITLNMFCTVGDYSIENLPSTWAAEFAANADWLKFAYHAEDTNTYLSNLTVEAAAASYAKFVNGIYTMTGTTDAIDRITRLGFYDGSKANCLALRDCACGIVGLLCSDDNRNSYYLTSEQSEFVRTHAYYRDYENQLIFLNTIRRFEYYTVTDAAELLTAAKGNINRYIEFFTHEAAATTDRFTPFAAWAVENGYKFGFMQQILRV